MRPRPSVAGVLVLLLLAMSHSAVPSGAARDEAFTLAVVRRDAIAIPFATYDGKRWKNAWPLPESRITAPISIADVPRRWWTGRDPIGRWTFWPIKGPSRDIETRGTAWFPSHCSQAVGLRTSYTSAAPVPPPNVQPYPKDGLAVAGPVTVTPVEILDVATSPFARELEARLAAPVYENETQTVRRYLRTAPGWSHSYNDAERKDTPVRLEALYKVAHGLGDRDVYYFEALKHYAVRDLPKETRRGRDDPATEAARARTSAGWETAQPGTPDVTRSQAPVPALPSDVRSSDRPPVAGSRQPVNASSKESKDSKDPKALSSPEDLEKAGFAPCDLVTFVSGWLARRGDEEKFNTLTLNVAVTSCDLEAAFIMLPLGVVHVKDKPLWAVQWSGWTHEHYSLLEVQDDRVVTVMWARGGSCVNER